MTIRVRELIALLENGEDVVAATIVGHAGSAPRGSGSKMLVRRDGSIKGSVGGGVLEAEVMRRAAGLFGKGGACIMHFDLTGEEAAKSGMICGGAVTVCLECMSPGDAIMEPYMRLAETVGRGRRAVMITRLVGDGNVLDAGPRSVLGQDGFVFQPAVARPAALSRAAWEAESACVLEIEGKRFMVEPHAAPHTAVVVGAGHVGLHTARMARAVGFRTVVLDDRKEFANRERFPEANEVKVVPGFMDCFAGLGVNGASFVLILTRGHVHDKVVLAQALETGAGYLGMIGSRKKRDAIYDALVEEGVSREELSRVFCPIGLDIDAETPEEIAVSIVAEMIQIRAGMQ